MYRGFEIQLAVTMRRVLVAETNPSHIRENTALKPSRQALVDLARTNPASLQCLAGASYRHYPQVEGGCTNLYMTTLHKKLVYLGIAMSQQQAEANWRDLLDIYRKNDSMLFFLKKRGPMVPIRYFSSIYLPVPTSVLTTRYLEYAVQSYCDRFIPELKELPISWVKETEAAEIDREIWTRAQQGAHRQTEEERVRIHANERDFSPSNSHE